MKKKKNGMIWFNIFWTNMHWIWLCWLKSQIGLQIYTVWKESENTNIKILGLKKGEYKYKYLEWYLQIQIQIWFFLSPTDSGDQKIFWFVQILSTINKIRRKKREQIYVYKHIKIKKSTLPSPSFINISCNLRVTKCGIQ